MTTLTTTPRSDDFHMPAEWALHSQTWMVWPQRPDNWRDQATPAQAAFTAVAKAIARFEPVTVCATADQFVTAREQLDDPRIRVVEISSDDAWVRDTGPTFVINGKGGLRGVDWTFNAWGGLNGGLYEDWQRDDEVALKILEIERCDRYRTEGFVLEGGSIHVDGEGTLITTEECLLNLNRNPTLTREDIAVRLHQSLGIERLLWLGKGLVGDHTDGHVDNLARFVGEGRLALPVAAGDDDPNAHIYADARARTAAFGGVEIVDLPSPGRVEVDGEIAAASYMNFYIGNSVVVVPTYGVPNDLAAVDTLAALFPDRRAIGVPARGIIIGGGSFHCSSQQLPA